MRIVAVSVLMALALAACGQAPTSSAPDDGASAPTETAPAPPPPPPPVAEETPATEGPADQVGAAPEPEPAPPQTNESRAAPPPATAAPQPQTRSLRVQATPVIVEIDRTQERRPANGGSSVVLFSEGSANAHRNLTTCTNIWNLMNTATTQEVRVGVRKASDGTVEALRPMYWMKSVGVPTGGSESSTKNANLTKNPPVANGGAGCASRMALYDYARAKTIRDKYRLTGAGPYFLVARTDEQAAAVINLTGKTDAEVADLVSYFRDGFAFQNDIWDPARNDPTRKRALLVSFFGPRFRDSLVASLGFVSAPAARAGCRLGDLRDAPCT